MVYIQNKWCYIYAMILGGIKMHEEQEDEMIDGEDALFGNNNGTHVEEKHEVSSNYSTHIEESVLACCILHSTQIKDVIERINVSDFYTKENKSLFSAIKIAIESNSEFDEMVLSDLFSKEADISPVNALNEISRLSNHKTYKKKLSNEEIRRKFVSHFKILKTYSAQRYKEIMAKKILTSKISSTPDEMVQQLSDISSEFNDIANTISVRENKTHHIKDAVNKLMKKVDKALESDDSTLGITTGFDKTDDIYSGYQPGDLIILAGRPSMGKTAICIQKMLNAAMKGIPVIFFSSEMPSEQIGLRMLANLAKINSMKIAKGQMSDGEWVRLKHAIKQLQELPITIDDTNGITISEIRQKTQQWYNEYVLPREKKDGLAIADYLQIIETTKVFPNPNERVGHISKQSKSIAREFSIPFIMLSQLNRKLEERPNKRPMNSDLRDSGSIEQDADIIVFIYRDEVYNKESAAKGIAELIYGKFRNGGLGTLFLDFKPEHQAFTEREYRSE